MEKLKNVFFYSATLVIGVVIFVYVYSLKLDNENYKSEVLSLNNKISNLNILVSNGVLTQYSNWKLTCDELKLELKVRSLNNREVQLDSILSNKKIVFYFSNEMCLDCLKKELGNLNTLTKIFNKDEILMLSYGYSSRVLLNNKEYGGWLDQIYITDQTIFRNSNNQPTTPILVFLGEKKDIKLGYNAMKNTNLNFELLIDLLNESNAVVL